MCYNNDMKSYELWKLHSKQELFAQADRWIKEFDAVTAGWDHAYGHSFINGKVYPGAVYFKNDEDYLVFRLRWRELLKF